MTEKIAGILIFITLIAISGGNAFAARQTFNELSLEILESIQSFYPVKSTEMGIHGYDHRLTDYSSKAVKNMIKKLDSYERKLYKYRGADIPLPEKINYRLIKSNVDITLLNLKQIAVNMERKNDSLIYTQRLKNLWNC